MKCSLIVVLAAAASATRGLRGQHRALNVWATATANAAPSPWDTTTALSPWDAATDAATDTPEDLYSDEDTAGASGASASSASSASLWAGMTPPSPDSSWSQVETSHHKHDAFLSEHKEAIDKNLPDGTDSPPTATEARVASASAAPFTLSLPCSDFCCKYVDRKLVLEAPVAEATCVSTKAMEEELAAKVEVVETLRQQCESLQQKQEEDSTALASLCNLVSGADAAAPTGDGVTSNCISGNCDDCIHDCRSGSAPKCEYNCHSGNSDSCTHDCHSGKAEKCTCNCFSGKHAVKMPVCSADAPVTAAAPTGDGVTSN